MFIPPPYFVIKTISNILPMAQETAHHILAIDRDLVHFVIDNESMPHNVKAFVILLSIQIAQAADHVGTEMMNVYFHSIKYLLEH
jgi:hypothetical protein